MTVAFSTVARDRSYSLHDGQDVDRGGDRHVGQRLAQHRGDALLMGGVGEGMQQAHGHGLHAHAADIVRRRAHAVLVERLQHDAAGADALVDLEHARGGHGPLGLDPGVEVCLAGDILPPDRQDVAEAPCRDERGRARPCPSRIMLVATVVPCSTRSTDAVWPPACVNARFTPVRNASRWIGRDARRLGPPDLAAGGFVAARYR